MLLSIASKVLCRVLSNRMKGVADTKLRDEQAGFLRGRSCTDHIATLRIIVEQSVEWQTSAYICFVDFQKPSPVSIEKLCGSCLDAMVFP